MRKRLTRIFGNQLLEQFSQVPPHTEINVVLKDGNTHFGKASQLALGHVYLIDGRGHIHKLRVSDIDVVIYDQISDY